MPCTHLYRRYMVYTAFCRQRTTRRNSFTALDTPALAPLELAGGPLLLSLLPMSLALVFANFPLGDAGKGETQGSG